MEDILLAANSRYGCPSDRSSRITAAMVWSRKCHGDASPVLEVRPAGRSSTRSLKESGRHRTAARLTKGGFTAPLFHEKQTEFAAAKQPEF
jgi:hypothetical protein